MAILIGIPHERELLDMDLLDQLNDQVSHPEGSSKQMITEAIARLKKMMVLQIPEIEQMERKAPKNLIYWVRDRLSETLRVRITPDVASDLQENLADFINQLRELAEKAKNLDISDPEIFESQRNELSELLFGEFTVHCVIGYYLPFADSPIGTVAHGNKEAYIATPEEMLTYRDKLVKFFEDHKSRFERHLDFLKAVRASS